MTIKSLGCAECGYPVAGKVGQDVSCPMCQTTNQITQGVTIPTWLLAAGIGLFFGIVVGPAILGSTEEGSKWLQRQATKRLK